MLCLAGWAQLLRKRYREPSSRLSSMHHCPFPVPGPWHSIISLRMPSLKSDLVNVSSMDFSPAKQFNRITDSPWHWVHHNQLLAHQWCTNTTCCLPMSSNRSPFQTGWHKRSVPLRVLPPLSSRTFVTIPTTRVPTCVFVGTAGTICSWIKSSMCIQSHPMCEALRMYKLGLLSQPIAVSCPS